MKNKKRYSLSLVIPCYNEEKRFNDYIQAIISFLNNNFENKELVLVNDGSSDNTLNLFKDVSSKYPFIKIVSYKKNMGKGYALKRGVLNSSKDFILISDMDLSTPLEELFKLEAYSKNNDIIIGSRALNTSNIVASQSLLKVLSGRFGNVLIKLILGLNYNDTQCGFKLFNKKSKQIFSQSLIQGFGYDFEILFLAKKYNFKVKEIGVEWENDFRSKVRLKHYFLTFKELLKVRLNWFFNKYK